MYQGWGGGVYLEVAYRFGEILKSFFFFHPMVTTPEVPAAYKRKSH